jgi:hypothetical protein
MEILDIGISDINDTLLNSTMTPTGIIRVLAAEEVLV